MREFADIIRIYICKALGNIKFYLYVCPLWRKYNKHNATELIYPIAKQNLNKIKVGNYTYGSLDCRINDLDDCYIRIGNYCSIAQEVSFLCGLDHRIHHFTTFPIGIISLSQLKCGGGDLNKINELNRKIKLSNIENYCKGPIIVDDDVWIGTGAKIMSGVHIGQGAVIAAGAVVTKDIPPYAIAGGVPAKVIKYRFNEDTIKKLLKIDYSKIPIEKFREIYDETINDDFDVDEILKKLKKSD